MVPSKRDPTLRICHLCWEIEACTDLTDLPLEQHSLARYTARFSRISIKELAKSSFASVALQRQFFSTYPDEKEMLQKGTLQFSLGDYLWWFTYQRGETSELVRLRRWDLAYGHKNHGNTPLADIKTRFTNLAHPQSGQITFKRRLPSGKWVSITNTTAAVAGVETLLNDFRHAHLLTTPRKDRGRIH